ncbi:MAG: hypothetical protein AAFQ01_00260 [Bacteroidota bacterium]
MRIKRLLLRLLGFELLAQELIRVVLRSVYSLKTDFKKKLAALAVRATILLMVIGLLHCALLFGLGALALYLSALLGSSYQGFLIVAGGCVGLSIVLLLLSRLWR